MSFLIAFGILYSFEIFAQTYVDSFRLENEFYSQTFEPNQYRILILGSSEVGPINATYIDEQLSVNCENCKTYNLAIPSDVPTERIATIEKIISMKPKIVLYGVGFRDFANHSLMPSGFDITHGPLPDPQKEFSLFLDNTVKPNFPYLQSPKYVTEKVLGQASAKNHVTNNQTIQFQTNTPFYTYTDDMKKINNDSQIYSYYKTFPPLDYIESANSNEEAIALEKITKKLQENKIDVIIFTTPYNKVFFNDLDRHNSETFNSILETLSQDTGVKIIHFEDKYANLQVWQDYHHISTNHQAIIFTEDIVNAIQSEIKCCLTQ